MAPQKIDVSEEDQRKASDFAHMLLDQIHSNITGCTCSTCVASNAVSVLIAVSAKDRDGQMTGQDLVDIFLKAISFVSANGGFDTDDQLKFYSGINKALALEMLEIMKRGLSK